MIKKRKDYWIWLPVILWFALVGVAFYAIYKHDVKFHECMEAKE